MILKNYQKIFNVSKQVIVRRALNLGYIDTKEYNKRIEEFSSYMSGHFQSKKKETGKNNKNTKV